MLEDPIISEHSFAYPHPFQVPHKNDQSKISPGKQIISGIFTKKNKTNIYLIAADRSNEASEHSFSPPAYPEVAPFTLKYGGKSSDSRANSNRRANRTLAEKRVEQPRPRTSLFPHQYERPVSRFSSKNDEGIRTPVDNFSAPASSVVNNDVAPKVVSKRPFYMSSKNSGSSEDFSNILIKIMIFILTVFLIAALMKGIQLAYYKILDIDNTVYCPSESAYDASGKSFLEQNSIRESFRIRNCENCTHMDNGHCNLQGRLICNSGFKQSGKKCIEDGAYHQKIEDLASMLHQSYLYHLGDNE